MVEDRRSPSPFPDAAAAQTANRLAQNGERDQRLKDEQILERLLSASASLAGVCVALLGVVHIVNVRRMLDADVDDALGVDSLLFLLCCYLIVWGLRTHRSHRARLLARSVDYTFLGAMTGLVAIGFWVLLAML